MFQFRIVPQRRDGLTCVNSVQLIQGHFAPKGNIVIIARRRDVAQLIPAQVSNVESGNAQRQQSANHRHAMVRRNVILDPPERIHDRGSGSRAPIIVIRMERGSRETLFRAKQILEKS